MKPSTIKRDNEVWKLWKGGMDSKDIRKKMDLTKDQFYKALARVRRRRGIKPRRTR